VSRALLLDVAFLLLLVALPLVSLGAVQGVVLLWGSGLVLLVVGFGLPLGLRFVAVPQPPEDEPDVHEEPS
jgi:hypothetical protein